VVADLQGLERCDSHLSYRANIVMRFVPDNDLWIHGLIFLFLAGQRQPSPAKLSAAKFRLVHGFVSFSILFG
jgi:hypothetical protein